RLQSRSLLSGFARLGLLTALLAVVPAAASAGPVLTFYTASGNNEADVETGVNQLRVVVDDGIGNLYSLIGGKTATEAIDILSSKVNDLDATTARFTFFNLGPNQSTITD